MTDFLNRVPMARAANDLVEIWRSWDRDVERYVVDPDFRAETRAAALATLANTRDERIHDLREDVTRESAAIERAVEQALRRDLDKPKDEAVDRAWRKIEPVLRAGATADQIMGMPDFGRPEIEALRFYWPSFVAATAGVDSLNDKSVREAAGHLNDLLFEAELRMVDEGTRDALVSEAERRRALAGFRVALTYDTRRRADWTPSPLDTIELGLTIADALGVPSDGEGSPGWRPWDQIAEEIEPGAGVMRARNSLPPEQREALDANIKQSGFSGDGPADTPLRIFGR